MLSNPACSKWDVLYTVLQLTLWYLPFTQTSRVEILCINNSKMWCENNPLLSLPKPAEKTKKSRRIASPQITAHVFWSSPNEVFDQQLSKWQLSESKIDTNLMPDNLLLAFLIIEEVKRRSWRQQYNYYRFMWLKLTIYLTFERSHSSRLLVLEVTRISLLG